ncbi:MAG TPA: isochorismatase family protein [Thermomicrobiales bacterium]|nr:isochorismatase family protein [Thermomicrobiales bacterium]
MAVTAIDPKTALVVIDLQKGIMTYPTVHPATEIVARSAELAKEFRRLGLPVILVNVNGGAPGRTEQSRSVGERPADWADLVPELDAEPTDYLVTKQTWGAFYNTSLHEYLQAQGVTQIVLTGISTSAGVESTARSAYEHGYNVTIATDAVTDMVPESHRHSVERVFPRLGETGTTAEIIELLARGR